MNNPDSEAYLLEQNMYSITKLEELLKDCIFDLFRTAPHRSAWITQTRPKILIGAKIISQVRRKTYNQEEKNDKCFN